MISLKESIAHVSVIKMIFAQSLRLIFFFEYGERDDEEATISKLFKRAAFAAVVALTRTTGRQGAAISNRIKARGIGQLVFCQLVFGMHVVSAFFYQGCRRTYPCLP